MFKRFLLLTIILLIFVLTWFIVDDFSYRHQPPILPPIAPKCPLCQLMPPAKSPIKKHKIIRILSIDGGGIRGIIPLHALRYLEKKTGKPIAQSFDLIVASSTGAIVSVGLTLPDAHHRPRFTAQEVLDFYNHVAVKTLYSPWSQKILSLNGILGPRYNNLNRRTIYQGFMGNTTLNELLGHIVMPAYDLDQQGPILFRNYRLNAKKPASDYRIADLILGASSAPGFFSPVKITSLGGHYHHTLIDGGLFLNNPAMQALIEAMRLYPDQRYLLVSLGTGTHIPKIQSVNVNHWGLVNWLPNLGSLIYSGSSRAIEHQLKTLFEIQRQNKTKWLPFFNYFRIDITLDDGHASAYDCDVKNVADLNHIGETMVNQNKAALNRIAQLLTAKAG